MSKMALVMLEGSIPHTIPAGDVPGFLRDHGSKAKVLREETDEAAKETKKRGRPAKAKGAEREG